MHDGDAGIADIARTADQSLDRRQIVLGCPEYPRQRIHRSGRSAVEHQLRCEIQLLHAVLCRAETERPGEIARHRPAQGAVDATHARACPGQVARAMHALRRFRQRQDADAAMRDPGAPFGIAQHVRKLAYFVGAGDLRQNNGSQSFGHRGPDLGRRAVMQWLHPHEGADTGCAQLCNLLLQETHCLLLELRRNRVLDIQHRRTGRDADRLADPVPAMGGNEQRGTDWPHGTLSGSVGREVWSPCSGMAYHPAISMAGAMAQRNASVRVRPCRAAAKDSSQGDAEMTYPTHLLPTTVVGSYPQPDWLVDRARLQSHGVPRTHAQDMWRVGPDWLEQAQNDATILAIREMERAGIDIVTDGEIRRESYSNRFALALEGIDETKPGQVRSQSGRTTSVPRVVGKIRRTGAVERMDAAFLLRNTDKATKITLPGPFTLSQQA